MKDLKTNKILVIFHKVDYDGLFSNAVVRKHYNGDDVVSFGYNYNDPIDDIPDFDDFDKIVIADISLPVGVMKDLRDNHYDKVQWVDHHITAINDSVSNGYDDMRGLRSTSFSACKLCWMYYFGGADIPYAVDLVATNDIWDKESYDWDNEVQAYQYGLNATYKMSAENISDNFGEILEDANVHETQKLGLKVKGYMDDLYKTWCGRFSFDVTVDGKWRGICMISPMFTSKIFDSVSADYDCCVILEKNGKQEGVYNVSLYSDKNIPELSCGDYMKSHYNGGGHKGAAGGTMTLEQFTRVLNEHTL